MRTLFVFFCAVSSLLWMTSCFTLPSSMRPKPEERVLPARDVPAAFVPMTATIEEPEHWWKSFNSAELDGLMDSAFGGNLSLAKAWTQLRQARAKAKSTAADEKLQLNGALAPSTTKIYKEDTGGDSSNLFSAGVTASYEVDLWGRIDAYSKAAEYEALASAEDVETTALVLSGEIANTWLDIKAAQEKLAVYKKQITTSRQSLDLLKRRQRKGLSAAVDVLQQEQLVAGLESNVPLMHEIIASSRLELAYLLGRSSDENLHISDTGLPELSALAKGGVPADLLENRADIRAAWLRLQGQEWTTTAAKAERLPALRLTGSATYQSDKINALFDNWIANLAASLTAPLLDGGRLKAEVVQNQALSDEVFLSYRDTVLTAVKEVNDALIQERWKKEYLKRLTAENTYALRTLEETSRRYRNGLSGYLDVLTAVASQHVVERLVITAQANLLRNRVDFYKALGGNSLPSETKMKSEKK